MGLWCVLLAAADRQVRHQANHLLRTLQTSDPSNAKTIHRGSASSIMERMSQHISIDRDAVSAFCRRHHITRLALFGSVLRDDFGPDSDVDVLVEFQAGHVPGFNFVSIEREFSGLLHGRPSIW